MSTTDAGTTAVIWTEDDLDPYVKHAAARRRPTVLSGRFAPYDSHFVPYDSQSTSDGSHCASYDGHVGPRPATRASWRLLTVFEENTRGEVPPYRKVAALIRPLALAVGPGTASGLTLDVPARLLDEEFGRGRVARFEDVDFPATLTHEPTRRFLRETGLPVDAFLFHLDTDVPLPTLAEFHEDEPDAELPPRADQLIRLGRLVEDNSLVVDGETAAILNWSESEATLHPLNRDVSALAVTLWLLHRERTIDAGLPAELTEEAYDQLATTMLRTLSTIDPTGPTRAWPPADARPPATAHVPPLR
ncbi:SUKH-4 family immunity protein [Streptomyces sp. NPDC005423]|uniref:SUKH-4 family immunity protein n=1 Tax=Streptomyces sp. NPDC005423 TaxID=3155343 RepID=UPI0033AD1E04